MIEMGWNADEVHKLEDHLYFHGQVNFVFQLANDQEDLFKEYGYLLSELFSSDINDYLLQQALLSKGDYLVERTNHSFCKTSFESLRSRNENWRQVFHNEEKRTLLKVLLDNLRSSLKGSLVDKLEEILKSHHYNLDDWQYYFLANNKAINECKYHEIRWFDENDIRILHSSTITGYHLELRTVWLFHKLEEDNFDISPFVEKEYLWDKNTGGVPGMRFKAFHSNEKFYNLDVRFSKDGSGYELCFYHNAETVASRNADVEMSKKVTDFVFDHNHRHFYRKTDKENVLDTFTQIFKGLRGHVDPIELITLNPIE